MASSSAHPPKAEGGPGASQDLRSVSGSSRIQQSEERFLDRRVPRTLSRTSARSLTRPLSPPRALGAGRTTRGMGCEACAKGREEKERQKAEEKLINGHAQC